ncbi:MAG TPA: IS5 family transposase [Pseudonocardia sp.]|nr:IS5 family transposase [Pseudonocardia sp.]
MADRSVISDEAWAWLEPLLPDRTPRRGGRWRDHREVLEAIAWKYRTGAPWRALPERFGPWQSVYDRHVRWSGDGTYDRLLAAAHTTADAAGELDWLVAADSSLMRVHQHGATARRTSGNAATVEGPTHVAERSAGSAARLTGGRSGILP